VMKNFLKILLIVACQIVLLTGMVFADFSENQDTYLSQRIFSSSVVDNIEKKNANEEDNKKKIDELYVELAEENILKKILPKLDAFGIVNATLDKESLKKELTREQLARLVVAALNKDAEDIKAAENLSLYTDLDTSDEGMPVGYINLAGSLGMIDEKGDGLFAPKDSVTYAEAITALVRILGYKDEFLPGSWPGNCIAKAAELDITDDVDFSPSGIVDRGDILILINNTLKARRIEKTEEDDGSVKYWEGEETFLKKTFGIDKYDGVSISKVKGNVNNECEITLEFLKDTDDGKYKTGDVKIFNLFYEGDILEVFEDFFAEEATIYIKENKEFIYIEE